MCTQYHLVMITSLTEAKGQKGTEGLNNRQPNSCPKFNPAVPFYVFITPDAQLAE